MNLPFTLSTTSTESMEKMRKLWRPVVGHEGHYEVSSHGDVRSLTRAIDCDDGRRRTFRGKPLSPNFSVGYPIVDLGKRRSVKVHRLVAEAFVEGMFEGAHVNHIDGDKTNNHCTNLEWVTQAENNRHAIEAGLARPWGHTLKNKYGGDK